MKLAKKLVNILLDAFIVLAVIVAMMSIVSKSLDRNAGGLFGYNMYQIISGSMTPTLPVDDIVIIKKCDYDEVNAEAKPKGDIITFYDDASGAVITHRAIMRDENGRIITAGDYTGAHDPALKEENLIGKVVLRLHYTGKVVSFMRTTEGIISVAVIMIALTLGSSVVNKKTKQKKQ